MRHVVSQVVSYEDLRKYFTGEHWKLSESEGSIDASSEAYEVVLKPKSMTFDVEISATDDPSDSEHKKVSDPVAFISKFLETGTGADDVLKKMSFHLDPGTFNGSPDHLMFAMVRMAGLLESGSSDLSGVRKILRRATVLMLGRGIRHVIAAAARAAAGNDVKQKEVSNLLKEMKSKGWKVEQSEDENGDPLVKVDVSGIYEATIKLDTTIWDYSYKVRDIDGSEEKGETEDPIQQFRLFYKKESTQDAKKELKEKKARTHEEGTIPAHKSGRKKKDEETQDESPRKRSDVDDLGDTLFAPTKLPDSFVPKGLERNKWSE